MYEHLFQAPLSVQTMVSEGEDVTRGLTSNASATSFAQEVSLKLKMRDYELKTARAEEATGQFSPTIERPGLSTESKISSMLTNNYDDLSNNYLLSQKLRNSGLYTKLKNKTIYSKSEFVRNHSMMNSGIL